MIALASRTARLLGLLALIAAVSCGGTDAGNPAAPTGNGSLVPVASMGRIEVRAAGERPRLTLVSRDGDPTPALVVAVATDLGPVATTALAALVEARMTAAGYDVDTRVDRSAFRMRWLADAARLQSFFVDLSTSFRKPVAPGGPELAAAGQRLASLRRNPLDAPELAPVASCTGRLGIATGDVIPDLAAPSGARELDGWRRSTLHAGRASLAAVGPATFCASVDRSLSRTGGWQQGPVAVDPLPTADSLGVYAAVGLDRRSARLVAAVRVADGRSAVAAADRLGASDSPLNARLASLSPGWRATEVIGTARPRGGCVAVTVEASQLAASPAMEQSLAAAAALMRQEIRSEVARGADPAVATAQILTAAEPREAASRAAWWALSSAQPGMPERWATAVALPPTADMKPRGPGDATAGAEAVRARLGAELGRAIAAAAAPATEKRVAIEQGQGEVWVLLGSPCGVADEGMDEAGISALAAATAVESRRRADDDVQLEPWITADGVGVIAHAAPRDGRETPGSVARRAADAAGRVLAAPSMSSEALGAARAATLSHLERSAGRQGIAMESLAVALAPGQPSSVEPFGLWSRVAGSGLEGVRLRWQALASGPVRLAILANHDRAQAAAAGAAADRWLGPRAADRTCRAATASAAKPGRIELRLPRDTPMAQALIGAVVPAQSAELAQLAALALDGESGLLSAALAASPGVRATARMHAGARLTAVIIDVRAPPDALATAVTETKALLARLGQTATDADLNRAVAAAARRHRDLRSDPRRRLVDLWTGTARPAPARPQLAAWRTFFAEVLRDTNLVVVEAKPES
jgi:hypothetical protein